jgi:hypothetical protein
MKEGFAKENGEVIFRRSLISRQSSVGQSTRRPQSLDFSGQLLISANHNQKLVRIGCDWTVAANPVTTEGFLSTSTSNLALKLKKLFRPHLHFNRRILTLRFRPRSSRDRIEVS